MITIQILGLDQFVVGHYSKEHSENLAQLFEVDEDDLVFYAPNSMIFHKGVEQTSWNTVVNILLPRRYDICEKEVANYLLRTLSEFSINLQVVFSYYGDHSEYSFINPDYPRYLKEENLKEADVSFEYGMPEGEEDEEYEDGAVAPKIPVSKDDGNPDDPDSIFLGNAFEGFEEALEERRKKN